MLHSDLGPESYTPKNAIFSQFRNSSIGAINFRGKLEPLVEVNLDKNVKKFLLGKFTMYNKHHTTTLGSPI